MLNRDYRRTDLNGLAYVSTSKIEDPQQLIASFTPGILKRYHETQHLFGAKDPVYLSLVFGANGLDIHREVSPNYRNSRRVHKKLVKEFSRPKASLLDKLRVTLRRN